MALSLLAPLLDLGKIAIDKIWPDPIKRAEEYRKLEELNQKGELAELESHVKLMLGQLEVNKIEAASDSPFKSNWRPAVGWSGVVAIFYQFVLYPVLLWGWSIAEVMGGIPEGIQPPPVMDSAVLFTLVSAMLGVGSMRSFDKKL